MQGYIFSTKKIELPTPKFGRIDLPTVFLLYFRKKHRKIYKNSVKWAKLNKTAHWSAFVLEMQIEMPTPQGGGFLENIYPWCGYVFIWPQSSSSILSTSNNAGYWPVAKKISQLPKTASHMPVNISGPL